MKRCPTCNRVYTDESLSFCLDDGGKLIAEAGAPQDPQATLVISPESLRTMQGSARQTNAQPGAPAPYAPPPSPYSPSPSSWGTPTPASPPARKRSALPWVIGGLAVVVVGAVGIIFLVFIIAAVSNSGSNNNNNKIVINKGGGDKSPTPSPTPDSPSTKVINSKDGVSELTVPAEWEETDSLNTSATIQARYPSENLYAIVITDTKSKLSSSTTLQSYAADRSRKITDTLTNLSQSGPVSITVNGEPGLIYEIHGDIKDLHAAYLFAVVETNLHFHQIGTWTLESQFADKRSTMESVIESLREK